MAYHQDTAFVLLCKGYEPLVDFEFQNGQLLWYHADPQPSEQYILDERLGCWKKEKKRQNRSFKKSANIRAYQDADGCDSVPDTLHLIITDLRQGFRTMVNDYAGGTQTISNQESQDALATRPRLDFLAKTDEAHDEIKAHINGHADQGVWDASSGSFPSGTASNGHYWRVSVAGTVDGQAFAVDDGIVALKDNPSTTTYADNWEIRVGASTVADAVQGVVISDASYGAVHARAYPTANPTLATRLTEYPECP